MKGIWRPSDRVASRYQYVPIEVGPDGFTVTLGYQGGVLDLGLFEQSGAFRGYSGGARDSFTVTPEWATPGYLPGPIEPGEWQVFLGLHRIPPSGVPWEITVGRPGDRHVAQPPPITQRPPRRADVPPGWLAGDLHAHTVHSDGASTIEELAALAVESGLDFLAVTDHNTVSHHPYLDPIGRLYGVTLIPGQEVITDRGHANAFGDIDWVDFRRHPDHWHGLLSINHPLADDCAWRHPLATRPRLAEVWHSGWWDRTWGAPLAWLLGWDPSVVPIGGSDFHGEGHLGQPTTWVYGPDVLAGLDKGRTAVSESPHGPLLLREGDEFLVLGGEGLLLTGFDGGRTAVTSPRWSTPARPGTHWLEDENTRIMALCA